MSEKAAKVIRIATLPPIMAFIMIVLMCAYGRITLQSAVYAVIFICIFPLLAYPVWWLVPSMKAKGRNAQRKLAVAFSAAGYLAGTVLCLFTSRERNELIIYLSYLITGVLIALFSYVFHIKGSGHAAGVSGPVTLLAWSLSPWFLLLLILLALVYLSSIKLGRHTLPQLLLGTSFPVIAVIVLEILL